MRILHILKMSNFPNDTHSLKCARFPTCETLSVNPPAANQSIFRQPVTILRDAIILCLSVPDINKL